MVTACTCRSRCWTSTQCSPGWRLPTLGRLCRCGTGPPSRSDPGQVLQRQHKAAEQACISLVTWPLCCATAACMFSIQAQSALALCTGGTALVPKLLAISFGGRPAGERGRASWWLSCGLWLQTVAEFNMAVADDSALQDALLQRAAEKVQFSPVPSQQPALYHHAKQAAGRQA